MNRKHPSLWDLFLIVSLGVAIGLGVLVMGCSSDVPIAVSPACECCGPDCSCEKCECKPKKPWKVAAEHKPAIAEPAVRIHDDRPWVHTIFLDGEPVADVKDMRESWKWSRDANGWEVATSDGELLWIPEEKTYGMKIIWRIEGRQSGAR